MFHMASFFPARCGKTSNGSGEGQQLGGACAQTVTETGGAKMGGVPTVGHALANWRVLAFPSGSCIFKSPRQSLRNRARPGNSIGYGLYTFLYIHIYIIFELISISIYLYIYIHIYIQFCFYVQTHVNLSTKPCDFGFCFALGFFKGTSEGMQSV